MTQNLAFLINPDSTTVRKKGSILSQIEAPLTRNLYQITSFETLPSVFDEIANQNIEWIFIEGGDGTIQGFLSALLRNKDKFKILPKITLVPGGLTNQIARNIGLKHRSLTRLQKLITDGPKNVKQTPMLHISITDHSDLYGFLFSSGAMPMATHYYTDQIHSQKKSGAMAVAQMLFKAFGGNEKTRSDIYQKTPLRLHISTDKEETHLDQEHLVSVVTTLPSLMLGLDPFWGDSQGPLRLTYVHGHAEKLMRNLLAVWAGRKHIDRKAEGFESFGANYLCYDYDGPLILDGEHIKWNGGRVEIRATEPINFVS